MKNYVCKMETFLFQRSWGDAFRALPAEQAGELIQAVAVKEAAAFRQSLFDYAPKSKPAADYMEVFDKIMQQ